MPPRGKRPIITLLTDFGCRDSFVAEMKGRLLSGCPDAQVVDITHAVEPFDIPAAAFILNHAYPAFPPGTIHVAVIDPGVGGKRRPVIVTANRHVFVGPDNGLFTLPAASDSGYRTYEITPPADPVAATFHGRDIFAPTAARLACGAAPQRLGRLVPGLLALPDLAPLRLSGNRGWRGRIILSDRFGNLITNFPAALLPPLHRPYLRSGPWLIRHWACYYSEAPAGRAAALINSQGLVEIFIPGASAQKKLHLGPGNSITLLQVSAGGRAAGQDIRMPCG